MRTALRNATVLALAAVLTSVFAACGQPSQTAAPTSSADDRSPAKYAECLRAQGLVMEQYTADDGSTQFRPDKQRNDLAKTTAAAEACRSQLPADSAGQAAPIPATDIEARRRYAACIRERGIPEFPDPDPATGEYVMDEELSARIKQNPAMRTAMESCRSTLPEPAGESVNG